MNCQFTKTKTGVKCSRCGLSLVTISPPEQCFAKCRGPRGVGDVVASVLKRTGVKAAWQKLTGQIECDSCNKRQDTLNKWIPFKRP